MLRTLMLTSSCVGLLVAAPAPAGAQQLYGSEERAFEQVARAVESFGYSQTLQAAEEVLAAAESARNAFATAEAARDSRHERIHALTVERAPACQSDPDCTVKSCSSSTTATWSYNNQQQDWLPYTGGGCLEHSSATSWASALRLDARHHDAVGEYMDLVGIDGTASAQRLAENTRLYANAFDRLRGTGIVGFLVGYYQSANDLHGYAVNAHVALHRAALEAVSRAGRAISQAADRLGDDYYGVGIENLRRYGATLDSAVSEARGAERDGEQTDRALDSMLAAARQTVAALRTNLEATRRYEAEPDPAPQEEPFVRPGRRPPAAQSADEFDFDAWAAEIRAAVAAAEQAASDAEAAALSSRDSLSRSNACLNAEGRVSGRSSRVTSLIYGNRFIPARGRVQAWSMVRERLEAAAKRARSACDSIVLEPPG